MIGKIIVFIQRSKSAVFPIAGTIFAGITQAIVVVSFSSY
jgi:hypothetical protein